jgi:CheY-like chemotaxis protein
MQRSNHQKTSVAKAGFQPTSILVVDDNPDHWTLMNLALKQTMPDVTAIWSEGADQALAYLDTCVQQKAELPKLILLDLYLPRRENGLYLLQNLKQPNAPYNRIPVISFSGSTAPKDVADTYALGVTAYTVKSPDYRQWLTYFHTLKAYWWETVVSPVAA